MAETAQASVQVLWARYRRLHPDAPVQPRAVFHFCDNAEDADLCAALVRAGRKRATASCLAELALAGEAVPLVDDVSVVTDWAGQAQAVIRTHAVDLCRFADVDDAFALAEGEGDGSLAWWRQAHRAYYRRVLKDSGHRIDDDLMIACERFEVVLLA